MLAEMSVFLFAGASLYEGAQAKKLWDQRGEVFLAAQRRAVELQRPLVVVGNPDAGIATHLRRAYGCGDICVDLAGCDSCPNSLQIDITKGIPGLPDNSAVVFVSCVLEYTDDPLAALNELRRVAGDASNLFVVTVDPNTMTSYLYPGAKHQFRDGRWVKIDRVERYAVAASIGVTGVLVVTRIASAFLGKK